MEKITKREFLKQGLIITGGAFCGGLLGAFSRPEKNELGKWSREAIYYSETPRGVKCGICPNECTLKPGEISVCHNRISKNGNWPSNS